MLMTNQGLPVLPGAVIRPKLVANMTSCVQFKGCTAGHKPFGLAWLPNNALRVR